MENIPKPKKFGACIEGSELVVYITSQETDITLLERLVKCFVVDVNEKRLPLKNHESEYPILLSGSFNQCYQMNEVLSYINGLERCTNEEIKESIDKLLNIS